MRVKIPVDNTSVEHLEAEVVTDEDLEMLMRVLRKNTRVVPSPSSPKEKPVREPPRGEGNTADAPPAFISHSQAEPSLSAPDAPVKHASPPSGYEPPKYEGLSKHEQLCLAVCDLNVNYGHLEPSANQVIRHLEATGGVLKTKADDRAAVARQAMRVYEGIISTGTGWRGTEEALRDFVARGLLWTQQPQPAAAQPSDIPNSQDEREGSSDQEVTDEEVNHTPFSPSSFNSLRS